MKEPQRFSAVFLLGRLRSEINRLFGEILGMREIDASSPRIDVVESEDEVVIFVEAAGIPSSELSVEVQGSILTVRGRRTALLPQIEDPHFLCMERSRGNFHRQLQIPAAVNSHRARAELQNGMLTITFPKTLEKRQRIHALQIVDLEEARDD
jgi:HSP20 family protein